MLVKDAPHQKAYELSELDDDTKVRIYYVTNYGRESLKCKVSEAEMFRDKLTEQGFSINSVFLAE